MTLEEKNEKIQDFCRTQRGLCEICVINGICHSIGGAFRTNESVCDEALQIIDSPNDNRATNDPVNSPAHYNDGKIEVIDYIEDKKLGFCLGNAIKYISRAGKKDPTKEVEDLKKAIWYVERRIKEINEEV